MPDLEVKLKNNLSRR